MNSGHAFTTLQSASKHTVATRVEAELSFLIQIQTSMARRTGFVDLAVRGKGVAVFLP